MPCPTPPGRDRNAARLTGFEVLGGYRVMPAVTAVFFTPAVGLLSIFGDSANNTIEVGRNAAGASPSTTAR